MNEPLTTKNDFILNVINLSVWYESRRVLENISFNIRDKEITSIIGPSGCGKSTLIRCFNRMNDFVPRFNLSGNIFFNFADIYDKKRDPVEIRFKIGMVFQKQNPFPRSIYENVAYGLRILGIRNRNQLDAVVEESLKKAALWDEVKEKLHEHALTLSGGQQQRLCIARALAIKPEVILLDEPCSSLDPIATARIEDLLQELKNNYTIIIVTHNMQQAARISDVTGFLYMGKLIEFGPTTQIFTRPREKLTENYISGKFG